MEGFTDGPGASVRLYMPRDVVVASNGDIFVADRGNHVIHVITSQGAVHTLSDIRQTGFADTERVDTRFNYTCGLALDAPSGVRFRQPRD